MVKNLPAMLEIWVQFLDWEDPLEKGMAAHSSVLAWRIPRTEERGESHGQRSLENPTDRGAWRIPRTEERGESHGQRSVENPTDRGAWRIPWTEEPGGLQSMGLQRGGHETEQLMLFGRCYKVKMFNPKKHCQKRIFPKCTPVHFYIRA